VLTIPVMAPSTGPVTTPVQDSDDKYVASWTSRCRLIFTNLIFIMVGVFHGHANADNAVSGMRIGAVEIQNLSQAGQSGLRLVVETKSPLKARLSLLQEPYRLVIDMPRTSWQAGQLAPHGALTIAPATRYRFGSPQPDIGRLVIEMDGPAAPVRVFTLPPNNGGHRFVVDMVDRGKTAFLVATAALAKNPDVDFSAEALGANAAAQINTASSTLPVKNIIATPTSKPGRGATVKRNWSEKAKSSDAPTRKAIPKAKPRRWPQKWVVFIDAGHGGKDPGAIGRAGTKEKTVTLLAAKDLARQLKATGKVTPVLARGDDRFLRLRSRINLARKHQADLFISLHADSAHSSKAHGISVFSLSDNASDKEAAALARKENKADLIGGPDLSGEDADAAGALVRMFQRESMNQSAHLASAILQQVRGLPGGDKRGHRFAGFAVLKAPDIPSVLVEMGFLSNRQDERNLNKNAYRRDLSRRLTTAIISYLNGYGPKL